MTRFHLRNTYFYKRTFQTKCSQSLESTRPYSENLSSNVRQKFLDYFIKGNNHQYVRSSPVMPYCDPTVAFVNAGMNQFKSIFLGQQDPVYKRVANSQKCIRVGGKHNDISIVGSDGYHHTFFEMLGNWSFDDYFKKEACEMAWNLLTGPYGLHPSSLYVTYFGGDSKLNLQPDLECKDIWRSLGIADDHILPFGPSENFWEMGPTGPCGPCTEIHIDHTGNANRSRDVNKNLPDLTELWNIVFIQYNRNIDGSIDLLPKHHIDTGMGLERLTAILQGKSSNYDTDIFSYLFDCIQKKCNGLPIYRGKFGSTDINGIDSAYRILADHSRMVTACLADGMIPEENQKLRRILRKSMLISETIFKQETGLLCELVKAVTQNLGEVYPEMERNLSQVQQIIRYEEEVYKSIRSTATKEWFKILEKEPKLKKLNVLEMPGLVTAYNELTSSGHKSISSPLAFKMYDTYGLDEYTIKSLAQALNFKFETNDLKKELDLARSRTKLAFLSTNNFEAITQQLMKDNIKKTEDHFKYNYNLKNGSYEFDNVDSTILCIVKNGNIVEEIEPNTECYLVLNRTNLYTESGGQISDKGSIEFSNIKSFKIAEAQNVNGFIFHKGISDSKLRKGETGMISIDKEMRLKIMANHTATHLINAALKKVIDGATCQKSSKVTPEWLSFDVGIYSKKLSIDDIENVEKLINDLIKQSIDVKIREINSQELLSLNNVTLIPGEVYPDVGIRLIEIDNDDCCFSREPCCGTHVLNTGDILSVCIINYKSLGRSTTSVTAVSGKRAILAHENGKKIFENLINIQNSLNDPSNVTSTHNLDEIKQKLNYNVDNEYILPVYVRTKCVKILNDINKQLRDVERDSLKQFIDLEMKFVLESNCSKSKCNTPYIVHFLGCSSILDNIPLQRATKICADIPVIVLSYSDEIVKARCCVPQSLVSSKFNADLWMKNTIGKVCKSSSSAPKGQDAKLVCNMKAKRINKLDWESVLEESIAAARNYADTNL